ncbi:hypothetical protein PA3071 [hydrothermal vent metagenome]|uniref:DUF58 domain-containing protein n=1 Tax=hydrothermal vent metagenome TaxID=652676 RepID=A0A3B1B6P9_9ZZZZ
MIHGSRNQHPKAAVTSENKITGIDRVQINRQSLIKLRNAGASLPLRAVKILGRMTGNYLSRFKGRGMEFDEARPYQPGDDARNLDWKVTARTGKPFTKLFREERERSVILWVDYRSPMHFATRGAFKSVLAARLAALLAWSAIHHSDRLGSLIFSESDHLELRPQQGKHAVLEFIRQLTKHFPEKIDATDQKTQTSAARHALARLRRVARPGSLLFLLSDFRSLDETAHAHLIHLARHNDVVLIFIHDQLEQELPPSGWYRLSNGQRTIAIDTGNKATQASYNQRFQSHAEQLQDLCKQGGIHLLTCSTDQDPLTVLQDGLGRRPT